MMVNDVHEFGSSLTFAIAPFDDGISGGFQVQFVKVHDIPVKLQYEKKEFRIQPLQSMLESESILSVYARTWGNWRPEIMNLQKKWTMEITSMAKEIEQFESNIITACHRIAQLRCTAIRKHKLIQASNRLLSPIRSLPSEILRIVFPMCADEDDYTLSPNKAPLSLCHVCKTWRDVAFDESNLWDKLHLNVRVRQHGNTCINLQNLAKMVVGNAHALPLFLELHEVPVPDTDTHEEIQCEELFKDFADILFPQCGTLDLKVNSEQWYKAMMALKPRISMFDKLETLYLYLDYNKIQRTLDHPLDIFKQCPNLSSITLDIQHPVSLTQITFPYPRLQKFNLRLVLTPAIPVSRCIHMWKMFLLECKDLNLVVARFIRKNRWPSSHVYFDDNQIETSATHSTIAELRITSEIQGRINYLFTGINFRNLYSLSFEGVDPCQIVLDDTWLRSRRLMHLTMDALAGPLSRLTHLALLRVFIQYNVFKPLFQATPFLCSLIIYNLKRMSPPYSCWCDDHHTVVDALMETTVGSPTYSGEECLPHLQSLTLYYPRLQLVPTILSWRDETSQIVRRYASLVNARAKMIRGQNVDLTYARHFTLSLNFSEDFHNDKFIDSVLRELQANISDEDGLSTLVNHHFLDAYDYEWEVECEYDEDYE